MTRAEASRNNGRKSRGPKTPEGKRKGSMNAVTHGLRSLIPALTNEDREGLERLERQYRETYRPAGPHEEELVPFQLFRSRAVYHSSPPRALCRTCVDAYVKLDRYAGRNENLVLATVQVAVFRPTARRISDTGRRKN
jgi:hypothetical protein